MIALAFSSNSLQPPAGIFAGSLGQVRRITVVAPCCSVCASSCAISLRPAVVAMSNRPGAKAMWLRCA